MNVHSPRPDRSRSGSRPDRPAPRRRRPEWRVLPLLPLLLAGLPAARAQSLADVPGVVLSHEPAPSALDQLLGNDRYISDAEILVLSNGDYIASHALFGAGADSDVSGTTRLFRSSDKGTNWTSLGTLTGILRGSLVEHEGALYLMGTDIDVSGGVIVIRKSLDNGTTWTTATDTNSGRFVSGGLGTPNNPVPFLGRLWSAASSSSFSAPVGSNLLVNASWVTGGGPTTSTNWLDNRFTIMTEGQVVASPEQGVVVMPKVGGLPYTALCRAHPVTGAITFDPATEFVELPGGEKKFGAGYDAASGKFFVLNNPVLPAHAADASLTPQLKRNTAAVLSSRDLYNWKVEKIFLYTTHLDYEAFQYFNFAIDGDDLVVASRTAFDVGGTKPDRGHDSNLLTFHRIPGFRALAPEHVLALDTANHRVLRHEKTQHADAPLGGFALGATFAGAALASPDALGQDAGTGDVYVREAGGRILRFDAAGNFLDVVASSPVPLQSTPLAVAQPPDGECSWVSAGSAEWREPLSWYYWGRPDTASETAVFGSAATGAATVAVNAAGPAWTFATNASFEGWTTNAGFANAVVTGGVLAATVATSDPQLTRTDVKFWGSRFSEVRLRLRMDATNAAVEMFWGTTISNAYNASRKLVATYTGDGGFQELRFPVAGHAQWDGNVIRRLRFDPLTGAGFVGRGIEIDSITVVPAAARIGGLRFHNGNPYTLAGTGRLRIEPDGGTAEIDVRSGHHVLDLPVTIGTNARLDLSGGASITARQSLDLEGHTLRAAGTGVLWIAGAFAMGGGTAVVDGAASIGFSNAPAATLDGTLRLSPAAGATPGPGDRFVMLRDPAALAGATFDALALPALDPGLLWDTSQLYVDGGVTVSQLPPVEVSVTAGPADGGTVSGGGAYPPGTNVALSASAFAHWVFTGWSDGDTNAVRTILVPSNATARVAYFMPGSGPAGGGSTFTIRSAGLGSGSDITNVTICGVAATIVTQTADSVTVVTGPGGSGTGGVHVVSIGRGLTVLPATYAYNPAGRLHAGAAGVSPALVPLQGGATVVLRGENLGRGDVTGATLCGVEAVLVEDLSPTQVVVEAGAAAMAALGAVEVRSTSHGPTVLGQAFAYGATVVATAGLHGSISPAGAVLVPPDTVTNFTVTADAFHRVASVLTNGAPVETPAAAQQVVVVIDGARTDGSIRADFAENRATNRVPEWWLALHYPASNDFNATALADTDRDGLPAWQEYAARTDPTNAASFLGVESVAIEGGGIRIRWRGGAGTTNVLQAAGDLRAGFADISPLLVLDGAGDSTTNYLEMDGATNPSPRFYRTRVLPAP